MKNLSVLHCIGCYLPMTQNWLYGLMRHLPETSQVVLARRYTDGPFYQDNIEYLGRRIPGSGQPVRTLLAGSARDLFLTLLRTWAKRQLRGRDIDIVHCHFADTAWTFRGLAYSLGALRVVSFYGWDYEHLPTIHPRWKRRMPRLFEESDLLICEGPHGAGILERLGCPPEKIRICRLGIDTSAIRPFPRNKEPGQLQLLQIASFREKKGHVDTVKAFTRVVRQCPNARLTLVGSEPGEIRQTIDSIIASENLASSVRIIGNIDFARLYEYMHDFQVFIHPSVHTSLKDCEGGAPIVLLDAQATGMPVISTRHCDIPEEVKDGETGLLCDEHDIDGLADAIRRFYEMDQNEYDTFATRASMHVRTHYDVVACARNLAHIYAEALDAIGSGTS